MSVGVWDGVQTGRETGWGWGGDGLSSWLLEGVGKRIWNHKRKTEGEQGALSSGCTEDRHWIQGLQEMPPPCLREPVGPLTSAT